MNYSSEFQNKFFTKFTGISLFFIALFLVSLAIFFAKKATSAAYEQDCATLEETAKPGNNCLFFNKKLCQTINNVGYTIDPASIYNSGTKIHRRNCADLSDLPLCTQIDGTQRPGKNCVKECNDSEITGVGVRGEDFAVHNRDCVRFCDAIESGVSTSLSLEQKCMTRRCHQVNLGVTPASPACEFMDCDLLTSDELTEARLLSNTSPKKYCNGQRRTMADGTTEPIKCYDFKKEVLQYVRFRGNVAASTQCQIHNCRATSQTCAPYASDDVSKILAKDAQQPGFSTEYKNRFNNNITLTDPGAYCTAVVCRPVVKRYYACTLEGGATDPVPTQKHADCESDCAFGACYKNIDCNLPVNATQEECTASQVNSDGSIGTDDDPVNSWFYRPKPMNKAYRVVGTQYEEMDQNQICYHTSNMKNNDFGYTDIFGSYYHNYLAYDTRSPGLCGEGSDGNGGYGYSYLCGTNGDFYAEANDSTAYIRGYAKSTLTNNEGVHKITVCVRFNNNMIPWKSCGRRECGITCYGLFGCGTQVCGTDSCYDLYVKDSEAEKCMLNDDTFPIGGESDHYDCLQVIDRNIRIRAVKYDNQICAFLDTSGTLAWPPNDDYLDGNQKLADGTCYSGHADAAGNCSDAINSNSSNGSRGLATYWRAIRMIPYIQNNQPAGRPQGYVDLNGRLYPKQECIKTTLRSPPPKMWNLTNASRANKLFIPPIRINNVRIKRDLEDTGLNGVSITGKTDFHYPEIEVGFGTQIQLLSLGAGKTGYETSDKDINASKTITSIFMGFSYSVDVFIRKEYNESTRKPLLCLYQKVKKADGTELEPIQVACVERNLPEINNSALRATDSSLDLRRINITADSTNTFRSSKVLISYTAGYGASLPQISIPAFGNPDRLQESCSSDVEKYKICIQRDYCSALESECAANEVNLYNAISNEDIQRFTAIKNNCETTITNICNTFKGMNDSGSVITSNAYGWFNEICITRGFETKLRTIKAYKLQGILGKCIIDEAKSKTVLDANSHACDSGGNVAIGCYCAAATDGVTLPESQIARKETPHEAGLCINLPSAQRCPAIDYNTSVNTLNPSDPEFALHSLGKSYNGTFPGTLDANYNSTLPTGGVHLSHKARSLANPFSSGFNAALISHAEFPRAIAGMSNVHGVCNGYWKNTTSDSGEELIPTMDCIPQASGSVAGWSSIVNNDCSRPTCPKIFTNVNGIEENGSYQNGYGILESGEDKGLGNGFATWPAHTQASDFAENQNAEECIPGFIRNGASTIVNTSTANISSLVSGSLSSNLTIASLYGRITGYSGGTLPSRKCNQNGRWAEFDTNSPNICRQLSCPEINDTKIKTLSTSGSSKYWELWRNSGGASFSQTNASRSKLRNKDASGTCNTALGFFQVGSEPPKRGCDYLGNWQAVRNPCTTKCDAIEEKIDAETDLHGFAYWKRANLAIMSEAPGEIDDQKGSSGCASGYIPYPYPPLKTIKGVLLTLSDDGNYRTDDGENADLMTIALNVDDDPRAPAKPDNPGDPIETPRYPERLCTSMTVTTPDGVTTTSNVWSQTSSHCINKCPGFAQDPRVNVGKTLHTLSDDSVAEVQWQEEDLDEYQTQTNCDGPGLQFSAATFTKDRSNGCYLLRRKCNSNGRWSEPEPMCVAVNGGQIGNATYTVTNPTTASYLNNAAVAGSTTRATGTCINNHWYAQRDTASFAPKMTCVYADGSTAIDKVYWKLTNSTRDCERIKCQAPAGNVISDTRSTINIAAELDSGSVVEGSCNAGYLQQNRTAPKVTCLSSGANKGTWDTLITDTTNCRKICTIPEEEHYLNADDCGSGSTFKMSAFTLGDGEVATFTACDACTTDADEGEGWWFYATCNDGTPVIETTVQDHSETFSVGPNPNEMQHMCPTRVFDGRTWTANLNSPNGDTGTVIIGGNQRSYVRNNLGVYINGTGARTRLSNARGTGTWKVQIDPAAAP